ncbi:NUDIX hydrolase [Pseudoalteromonas sp. T1lg65]|uniref:NUDIX hydrolase n=1 Tax=Pseudoalteromonas sp. T1lg65 TaxID=2077101 RepID=UPI003F7960A1
MQILNIHPAIQPQGSCFTRITTRAIVLQGDNILLLYTARYDDYTLPGGGADEGESLEQALQRELTEETGAHSILRFEPFGKYEEYRPWYKPDFDNIHIVSYCYLCDICGQFSEPEMEHYEALNGMKPVWMGIDEAIAHNQAKLDATDNKGLSLERELILLKQIANQLLDKKYTF